MNMTGKTLNAYTTMSVPTFVCEELNRFLLTGKWPENPEYLELIKKELTQANGLTLLTHQMDVSTSKESMEDLANEDSDMRKLLNVHCPLFVTPFIAVMDKETKTLTDTGFDVALEQCKAGCLACALEFSDRLLEGAMSMFDLPRPELNLYRTSDEDNEAASAWLESRLGEGFDGCTKDAFMAWKLCIYEDEESLTYCVCFVERQAGEAFLMSPEYLMSND